MRRMSAGRDSSLAGSLVIWSDLKCWLKSMSWSGTPSGASGLGDVMGGKFRLVFGDEFSVV